MRDRVVDGDGATLGVSDAPPEEITPEMRRAVENNVRALREMLTNSVFYLDSPEPARS